MLKGVFGSLCICVLFPLVCFPVSTISLFLALLGPVLVPAVSLMFHLVSILVFDIETYSPIVSLIPNITWNVIFLGLLQPIICSIHSLVICPLLAGFIAAFAVTRKGKVLNKCTTIIRHSIYTTWMGDLHQYKIIQIQNRWSEYLVGIFNWL